MIAKPAGDPHAVPPQVRLQRRILTVKIVLLISFAVIAGRLVQIQAVQAGAYQEMARRQYEAPMKLPAARGIILDRNGKVLVSNTMFASFAADPKEAGRDRNDIAVTFAQVFNRPREVYLARLRDQDKRFVWLERGVPPHSQPVFLFAICRASLRCRKPNGCITTNIWPDSCLGHTGVDHSGLSGLELQYDRWLRGSDGFVTMQRDALRRTRPSAEYPRMDPVDGQNILLTIDAEYRRSWKRNWQKGWSARKRKAAWSSWSIRQRERCSPWPMFRRSIPPGPPCSILRCSVTG